MKKVFLLLGMLILTQMQACSYIQRKAVYGVPMLAKILEDETMDEVVKMGLFDGCFSAYSARGNSFYKTMFYFRQNPELINDDRYRFAWGRGYGACFPEAIMWTYNQPLGNKFVNTDGLGKMIQPFHSSVDMPIGGGDAESKPVGWYFDEDINRGFPGVANYGSPDNFFGAFGTCQFCGK